MSKEMSPGQIATTARTLAVFRDNVCCVVCGNDKIVVHHILPIDDVSCLVCLCHSCHQFADGRCFILLGLLGSNPNPVVEHLLTLISEHDISDTYKEILSNVIAFGGEREMERERERISER